MTVQAFYEKYCTVTSQPATHGLKNDCVISDSYGWSVYYYGSLIASWKPDAGFQIYLEHFSASTTKRHNLLRKLV